MPTAAPAARTSRRAAAAEPAAAAPARRRVAAAAPEAAPRAAAQSRRPASNSDRYILQARSTETPPATYVYGAVTFDEKTGMFTIGVKRPRSPRVDTFRLSQDDVIAALVSPGGYIVTEHPDFAQPILSIDMHNAVQEKDSGAIWGSDAAGNTMFLNEDAIDLAKRWASIGGD